MQLISDLKHMRLYSSKRKVYMPFNPSNKRKGATIKLLTRDIEDSMAMINLPYLYNPKLYRSYYMPKNVMAYIDSKGIIDQDEIIEDENEKLLEATIHKASSRTVTINTHGTPADKAELSNIFSERTFKKWFRKLGKPDYKFNVTIYGFNSRSELIKAVGTEIIMKYSDVVFNSYCTPNEIYVLNRSAFKEIENQEVDYKMYCENELITWVCMTCSKECHRKLANYVGCGMSGQAKKIRDTKWDKQEDIHSDIGLALTIVAMYNDLGDKGLARIVRTGDPSILAHYKADGLVTYAKAISGKLINKAGNYVLDRFEEQVVLESDGTHDDVLDVYNAMDDMDQHFLANRPSMIIRDKGDRVLYRHIERDIENNDIKGFIEIIKDNRIDNAAYVVIGVHPTYRREGIGKQLIATTIKDIPIEQPDLNTLIWRADKNNIASQKLACNCGFKPFEENNNKASFKYSIKKPQFVTPKTELQQPTSESKIAHIPVPRMSIYEQSRDAGYFANRDYLLSENMICFFDNDKVIQEANAAYDTRIRRYLYKQRIKTNKDLLDQYNRAKELNSDIEKTFLNLEMYKKFNLFVDISYYNGIFLSSLTLVKDKGVDFYWDFMNRLLEDSDEMKRLYPVSTIFIPVSNEAWRVPAGVDITDYKQTINPISVILRMIKTKPMELKNQWKNKSIVFMGKNGYFTIDFNKFEYKNVPRLKGFIDKLTSGENISDDINEDGYDSGTDTDSKSAIGMNIVDKIEKSSGISIDNVSRLVTSGSESLGIKSIDQIPTMRIRDTPIKLTQKWRPNQKPEDQETIGIGVLDNVGLDNMTHMYTGNKSKVNIDFGYIYSIYDNE